MPQRDKAYDRAYSKAYRARQKALGLCIDCRNPAKPPYSRCQKCRRRAMDGLKRHDRHKKRRLQLRSAGLCPHCGKPCAPYYWCEERREYVRNLQKAKRKYTRGPYKRRSGRPNLPRGNTRRWKPEDDALLLVMNKHNVSTQFMALHFNRKVTAIEWRFTLLQSRQRAAAKEKK